MKNKQEKIKQFMQFSKETIIDNMLNELEEKIELKEKINSIFYVQLNAKRGNINYKINVLDDKHSLIGMGAAYDYLEKEIPFFNTLKAWERGQMFKQQWLVKLALSYFHGIDDRKKYIMEGN